jgi:Cof subfamily protein (haloacid dehalogenase superfamily)
VASIRLLAIDVDGTLLDSRHGLSSENASALRDAQNAGIHVVLASSRPPRAILPILLACGLRQGVVVAYQGAMILNVAEGVAEVRREWPMPSATAHGVFAKATEAGGAVNWYVGDAWLCSRMSDRIEAEARIVGYRPELVNLEAVRSGAHKLLVLGAAGTDDTILDAVKRPDIQAEISKPGYVEITRCGVDKGSALRTVLSDLGVESRQMMAIGDGANDLAMLRVAGIPVAMGNAPHLVRQAARYVTATNDESGVAKAIRAHALQG